MESVSLTMKNLSTESNGMDQFRGQGRGPGGDRIILHNVKRYSGIGGEWDYIFLVEQNTYTYVQRYSQQHKQGDDCALDQGRMKGVESSRKIRGGEINVYACDALFIIGSNNSRNNEEDKNPRRSSSTRARAQNSSDRKRSR